MKTYVPLAYTNLHNWTIPSFGREKDVSMVPLRLVQEIIFPEEKLRHVEHHFLKFLNIYVMTSAEIGALNVWLKPEKNVKTEAKTFKQYPYLVDGDKSCSVRETKGVFADIYKSITGKPFKPSVKNVADDVAVVPKIEADLNPKPKSRWDQKSSVQKNAQKKSSYVSSVLSRQMNSIKKSSQSFKHENKGKEKTSSSQSKARRRSSSSNSSERLKQNIRRNQDRDDYKDTRSRKGERKYSSSSHSSSREDRPRSGALNKNISRRKYSRTPYQKRRTSRDKKKYNSSTTDSSETDKKSSSSNISSRGASRKRESQQSTSSSSGTSTSMHSSDTTSSSSDTSSSEKTPPRLVVRKTNPYSELCGRPADMKKGYDLVNLPFILTPWPLTSAPPTSSVTLSQDAAVGKASLDTDISKDVPTSSTNVTETLASASSNVHEKQEHKDDSKNSENIAAPCPLVDISARSVSDAKPLASSLSILSEPVRADQSKICEAREVASSLNDIACVQSGPGLKEIAKQEDKHNDSSTLSDNVQSSSDRKEANINASSLSRVNFERSGQMLVEIVDSFTEKAKDFNKVLPNERLSQARVPEYHRFNTNSRSSIDRFSQISSLNDSLYSQQSSDENLQLTRDVRVVEAVSDTVGNKKSSTKSVSELIILIRQSVEQMGSGNEDKWCSDLEDISDDELSCSDWGSPDWYGYGSKQGPGRLVTTPKEAHTVVSIPKWPFAGISDAWQTNPFQDLLAESDKTKTLLSANGDALCEKEAQKCDEKAEKVHDSSLSTLKNEKGLLTKNDEKEEGTANDGQKNTEKAAKDSNQENEITSDSIETTATVQVQDPLAENDLSVEQKDDRCLDCIQDPNIESEEPPKQAAKLQNAVMPDNVVSEDVCHSSELSKAISRPHLEPQEPLASEEAQTKSPKEIKQSWKKKMLEKAIGTEDKNVKDPKGVVEEAIPPEVSQKNTVEPVVNAEADSTTNSNADENDLNDSKSIDSKSKPKAARQVCRRIKLKRKRVLPAVQKTKQKRQKFVDTHDVVIRKSIRVFINHSKAYANESQSSSPLPAAVKNQNKSNENSVETGEGLKDAERSSRTTLEEKLLVPKHHENIALKELSVVASDVSYGKNNQEDACDKPLQQKTLSPIQSNDDKVEETGLKNDVFSDVKQDSLQEKGDDVIFVSILANKDVKETVLGNESYSEDSVDSPDQQDNVPKNVVIKKEAGEFGKNHKTEEDIAAKRSEAVETNVKYDSTHNEKDEPSKVNTDFISKDIKRMNQDGNNNKWNVKQSSEHKSSHKIFQSAASTSTALTQSSSQTRVEILGCDMPVERFRLNDTESSNGCYHGIVEVDLHAPQKFFCGWKNNQTKMTRFRMRRIAYGQLRLVRNQPISDSASVKSKALPTKMDVSLVRLRDVAFTLGVDPHVYAGIVTQQNIPVFPALPFLRSVYQTIYDPIACSEPRLRKCLGFDTNNFDSTVDQMIYLEDYLRVILPRYYQQQFEIGLNDLAKYISVKTYEPINKLNPEVIKMFQDAFAYNMQLLSIDLDFKIYRGKTEKPKVKKRPSKTDLGGTKPKQFKYAVTQSDSSETTNKSSLVNPVGPATNKVLNFPQSKSEAYYVLSEPNVTSTFGGMTSLVQVTGVPKQTYMEQPVARLLSQVSMDRNLSSLHLNQPTTVQSSQFNGQQVVMPSPALRTGQPLTKPQVLSTDMFVAQQNNRNVSIGKKFVRLAAPNFGRDSPADIQRQMDEVCRSIKVSESNTGQPVAQSVRSVTSDRPLSVHNENNSNGNKAAAFKGGPIDQGTKNTKLMKLTPFVSLSQSTDTPQVVTSSTMASRDPNCFVTNSKDVQHGALTSAGYVRPFIQIGETPKVPTATTTELTTDNIQVKSEVNDSEYREQQQQHQQTNLTNPEISIDSVYSLNQREVGQTTSEFMTKKSLQQFDPQNNDLHALDPDSVGGKIKEILDGLRDSDVPTDTKDCNVGLKKNVPHSRKQGTPCRKKLSKVVQS